jgi:hypothetical protein
MSTYDTAEVADMVARCRPDRYHAGDIDWAAAVVDAIADSIPAAVAQQRTAEQIVRGVERTATRRTNKLMREVLTAGALPLDWMDCADWPMAVAEERVCLRAMTAEDLRRFADDEEEAASKDFAARLDAVKGARLLADEIDDQGCRTVGDLNRKRAHS